MSLSFLRNPATNYVSGVFFRLVFLYVFLYGLMFISMITPFNPLGFVLDPLVQLTGSRIFGVTEEITLRQTGSGDVLYLWIQTFVVLMISVLGAAIWSGVDRQRTSYPWLKSFLFIYLRYWLALIMLIYGISKVIPMQFPDPSLIRLSQEYGNSSPMGLAWTFMGFAAPNQMFAGALEVLGGVLLLFRKTSLLGALVIMGVMSNVFMMNMFFDVPVKLFSGHILLFATGLALINIKPLLNFFFFGKAARQINIPPLIENRNLNLGITILKRMFAAVILLIAVVGNLTLTDQFQNDYEIAGIYEVEYFISNGDTLSVFEPDAQEWNRMVIDDFGMLRVALDYPNRTRALFQAEADTGQKKLTADHSRTEASISKQKVQVPESFDFEYRLNENGTLTLEGEIDQESWKILLRKLNHEEYLLISRGFNWVNEFPFNR